MTNAVSEKRDKQIANRRLRAAVRAALHVEDELLPRIRDVSNVWSFDKDGKRWAAGRQMIDPRIMDK